VPTDAARASVGAANRWTISECPLPFRLRHRRRR